MAGTSEGALEHGVGTGMHPLLQGKQRGPEASGKHLKATELSGSWWPVRNRLWGGNQDLPRL